MDLLNELFIKVRNEIEDRTIRTLDAEYSIYRHRVVLIINGKHFNISERISDEVWNLGGEYKSPEDKWKITVEVNKKAREFLCDFDPHFDIDEFPGFSG